MSQPERGRQNVMCPGGTRLSKHGSVSNEKRRFGTFFSSVILFGSANASCLQRKYVVSVCADGTFVNSPVQTLHVYRHIGCPDASC